MAFLGDSNVVIVPAHGASDCGPSLGGAGLVLLSAGHLDGECWICSTDAMGRFLGPSVVQATPLDSILSGHGVYSMFGNAVRHANHKRDSILVMVIHEWRYRLRLQLNTLLDVQEAE